MIPATQPLRDEHRALLPELGALRSAADAVGTPSITQHLVRARRLLERHLVPHMAAEEAVLYPTIDRVAGHEATVTLRHDHHEIRRRMRGLDEVLAADHVRSHDEDLRAALYGLDAIVHLHLQQEEELFYPLLDAQLSDADANSLVTALHAAERDHYNADHPGAQ
jgi:iron-sulfur cluster repair protein YtfE (RIC family)